MNNFKAFIEALEIGDEFSLSGLEARKAVEVILAIYRSAREQKCIKL
jgi:predicted dehydrogenase